MKSSVTIERGEEHWCSFDDDDESDTADLTVCSFQESQTIRLSPNQALKLSAAMADWAKRKMS